MKRAFALIAGTLLAAAASAADPIRIWGPPAMRGIAQRWADAYAALHPGVRIELTMRGSDTAIPGLYGGQADIADAATLDDDRRIRQWRRAGAVDQRGVSQRKRLRTCTRHRHDAEQKHSRRDHATHGYPLPCLPALLLARS